MMDLNDLVFGKIKVREILGAEPDLDFTRKMLEDEIRVLIKDLEGKNPDELMKLKTQQLEIHKEINSRPGAMALPQSKIKLFSEFSSQYIDAIQQKIN